MSRLLALLLIACGDKAACPDGFVMGEGSGVLVP